MSLGAAFAGWLLHVALACAVRGLVALQFVGIVLGPLHEVVSRMRGPARYCAWPAIFAACTPSIAWLYWRHGYLLTFTATAVSTRASRKLQAFCGFPCKSFLFVLGEAMDAKVEVRQLRERNPARSLFFSTFITFLPLVADLEYQGADLCLSRGYLLCLAFVCLRRYLPLATVLTRQIARAARSSLWTRTGCADFLAAMGSEREPDMCSICLDSLCEADDTGGDAAVADATMPAAAVVGAGCDSCKASHTPGILYHLEPTPLAKAPPVARLLAVTRCGHTFHEECLALSARQRQSCPLCRAPLSEEPIFEDVAAEMITAYVDNHAGEVFVQIGGVLVALIFAVLLPRTYFWSSLLALAVMTMHLAAWRLTPVDT
mmetsp:Transcript_7466/g.18820  ORF Transcript_7466/g.18820 Transcript_7466/m.18820 type:complete len:374 (-) Transcript_7466:83-1204(-)